MNLCWPLAGNLQHAWECFMWTGGRHAWQKDWENFWENGFQWWRTFNKAGVYRGLYEGPSPVSNAYSRCSHQPVMVPDSLFHFIPRQKKITLKNCLPCQSFIVASWSNPVVLEQNICFMWLISQIFLTRKKNVPFVRSKILPLIVRLLAFRSSPDLYKINIYGHLITM